MYRANSKSNMTIKHNILIPPQHKNQSITQIPTQQLQSMKLSSPIASRGTAKNQPNININTNTVQTNSHFVFYSQNGGQKYQMGNTCFGQGTWVQPVGDRGRVKTVYFGRNEETGGKQKGCFVNNHAYPILDYCANPRPNEHIKTIHLCSRQKTLEIKANKGSSKQKTQPDILINKLSRLSTHHSIQASQKIKINQTQNQAERQNFSRPQKQDYSDVNTRAGSSNASFKKNPMPIMPKSEKQTQSKQIEQLIKQKQLINKKYLDQTVKATKQKKQNLQKIIKLQSQLRKVQQNHTNLQKQYKQLQKLYKKQQQQKQKLREQIICLQMQKSIVSHNFINLTLNEQVDNLSQQNRRLKYEMTNLQQRLRKTDLNKQKHQQGNSSFNSETKSSNFRTNSKFYQYQHPILDRILQDSQEILEIDSQQMKIDQIVDKIHDISQQNKRLMVQINNCRNQIIVKDELSSQTAKIIDQIKNIIERTGNIYHISDAEKLKSNFIEIKNILKKLY